MAKRFFLIRARLAYQTLRDEWGPGGPSPVFEQPRFGVTPLPDSIRGGIEWRENPGFLARRRWTPPIRVELTLGYQGIWLRLFVFISCFATAVFCFIVVFISKRGGTV
jgi:hypothetical protein